MKMIRSTIAGLALLVATCGDGRKYEEGDCTTIENGCSSAGCYIAPCHDYSPGDLCRALFNCDNSLDVYECSQELTPQPDVVADCIYDGYNTIDCRPGLLKSCQDQGEY